MKRRDFMKRSATVGACCFAGGTAAARAASGDGFDIHPFLKAHPEAVFIARTNVSSKEDANGLFNAGEQFASDLIVPVSNGGYANSTKITVKPNWTCSGPKDGKPVMEKLGVNTDPNFIAGWVTGMRTKGPQDYYIRECACPQAWEDMGWSGMCDKYNINLRDLSSMDYWELEEGKDIIFRDVPDGVVMRKIGFMAPMTAEDTVLINIAKLKAHGMGITASIKNLQGISGKQFHNMCARYDSIKKNPKYRKYTKFFQKKFEKNIEKLYKKHLKDGIPRWDRPDANGGIWQEQWVNRMLDSLSVTPCQLHMVEGVYSQDGNGFGSGPHDKLGKYGVTSRDYMSNIVIFGLDPFRVDIVSHWLAGHEPGNFGLFHIGIERGMSDVLDPADIPIYEWKNGKAEASSLKSFDRTPLVTYYLQRDYDGQNEPQFHMCDEPFDYTAWKKGTRVGDCTPSIRQLGRDGQNRVVMELNLPKREDVWVDVRNKRGEVVWRLIGDGLEPGVHEIVWDNFDSPGLYSAYVKGMGWEAKEKIQLIS